MFKKNLIAAVFLFTLGLAPFITAAIAFTGCESDCQKCHSLSREEVNLVLKKIKTPDSKILNIQMSPVKGLWEVSIEKSGSRALLYVDFSKKYLVAGGSIVEVDALINKTKERLDELNKDKRINPATVPLKDALVVGSGKAKTNVIVFTDPDCPYCEKLHNEIKKVTAQRLDIAFYLKLLPLKMHPDAYWKSKSIICNKSLKYLEDNFEKKPIPRVECNDNSKEIDNNIKFAEKNGISGTPTIILPDGSLFQGHAEPEKLIKMIDDAAANSGRKTK